MRRRHLLLGFAVAPAAIAQAQALDAIPVVASFSILADMVRQIGGDAVSVSSLVPPDGDPHTYEPRPSDLRAVAAARLLVVNGLGLEGWMTRLVGSAGYRGAVATASTGIRARTMVEDGGAAITDPHAWQDASNGALTPAPSPRHSPRPIRRARDGFTTPANAMPARSWIPMPGSGGNSPRSRPHGVSSSPRMTRSAISAPATA